MLRFTNNAETTLASALGGNSTDTTVTVASDGSANSFESFPLDLQHGQLATLTHSSLPGTYEVVKIVERVYNTNTFTVVRAYEGEVQAWPSGTSMSARITAMTMASMLQGDESGRITKGTGGGDYDGSFVFCRGSNEYGPATAGTSQNGATTTGFIFEGRSRLDGVVQLSGYPTLQLIQAKPSGGEQPQYQDTNMSYPSVGGTFPVDIGVPQTWAAKTYYRGSVVVPTVPNGEQYWLDPDGWNESSESVEPDWASLEYHPMAADGVWVPTSMPIDFNIRFSRRLVVTEVGFITQRVTASTTPVVSIGTSSDPVRFANGVSLSQITGPGHIHRIPVTSGGALVFDMQFRVDTAATGGQFMGRFYWRGFFVEVSGALS